MSATSTSARRLAFLACVGTAALALVAAFSLREVAPGATAVLHQIAAYALYAAIPLSLLVWLLTAAVSAARRRGSSPQSGS